MSDNDVTIDTNVFEHLFNPQNNEDQHIDKLLQCLFGRRSVLCLDQGGRISGEYDHRLRPLFKRDDQDQKLYLLRYFLLLSEPHKITVNFGDALMVSIRGRIGNAEPSDHIFVYVAIASDSILVSNDAGHITDHRNQLRTCRPRRCKTVDFVSSIVAGPLMGCDN
jgi:hypothetical protein